MHNLLRYIRMNKKKIIKVALIIAFLIIVLQVLNYLTVMNKGIELGTSNNSDIVKESNGTITSDKSAVTGGKVSTKQIKEVGNIINEFVDFCNNGKVEDAYNMLSDSCKEVIFPNIESFKEYYYEKIFNGKNREYTLQNWSENIYIVRFTEDLLSTGKSASSESNTDYITIIDENGQKKLNINSFIKKEEINKENEEHNIKINVLNRVKYMDYEIYEIEVTNNTKNTILLNSKYDEKGMYIKDNNDNRHYAYSNEVVEDNMKILSKYTKKIKIKFDNPYIVGRKINNICFPKIILNYSEKNYGASLKTKVDVNI